MNSFKRFSLVLHYVSTIVLKWKSSTYLRGMKAYLDLLDHLLENGVEEKIELVQALLDALLPDEI